MFYKIKIWLTSSISDTMNIVLCMDHFKLAVLKLQIQRLNWLHSYNILTTNNLAHTILVTVLDFKPPTITK